MEKSESKNGEGKIMLEGKNRRLGRGKHEESNSLKK
jgi:hypothetical protein